MAELKSVKIVRRLSEEIEFLNNKDVNEIELLDLSFEELSQVSTCSSLRQSYRASSFSTNCKNKSSIQNKIKSFEIYSNSPAKVTPMKSRIVRSPFIKSASLRESIRSTPIKNTPIKYWRTSTPIKYSIKACLSEESIREKPCIVEEVINPFLKTVCVRKKEDREIANNKSETNSPVVKVSNYTLLFLKKNNGITSR